MAAAFVLGEVYAAGYGRIFLFLASAFCAVFAVGLYPVYRHGIAGFEKKKGHLCADLLLFFLCFCLGAFRFRAEEEKRVYGELVGQERTEICGRVDWVKETGYGVTLMLSRAELRGGETAGLRLAVEVKEAAGVLPGDTVWARGTLEEFESVRNPGEFDSFLYYRSLGCHYSFSADEFRIAGRERIPVYRLLMAVRGKLTDVYREICTHDASGIYQAMLLGEKGELSADIKELYSDNGISHILAISGLHIAVLGMGLYRLLRKLGGFRFSGLTAGLVISLYVMMTGSAVSARRAGIMFLFQLLSFAAGRSYDMLSAASAALLILLWQNPRYLFNSGCQLSFGAVFAIGLVYPAVSELFEPGRAWIKAFLSSVSVSLVTFPILSLSFYEVSLYSVALNLVVIPCMTLVMLSGLLGGAAGAFCPGAGRFLIALGQYILFFYKELCEIFRYLPGNRLLTGKPDTEIVFLYYLILSAGLLVLRTASQYGKFLKGLYPKRLFAAAFLALMPFFLCIRTQEGLYVCFLDVSQGDGIYMETPEHVRILVDGGSSDKRKLYSGSVLPFLKSRGAGTLDFAVVTHPDEDHISALRELLEEGEIKVRKLLLPEIGSAMKDEAYLELAALAEKKGVSVGFLSLGDAMRAGELTVICLYPYEGLVTEDRNGYSTVLDIGYGDFSMLLTGDLGEEGERFLTQRVFSEKRSYTVLKIAHHGSKYSTCEEFLDRIEASYAVISCGERNRYGHPHREVLERLSKAGIPVLLTPEHGAVQWEDGKIIDIP